MPRPGPRVVAVVAAVAASVVMAAAPITTVPPDRLLFDSNRTGTYEVFTMGTDGSSPVQLTDDPTYDSWWPKLSPDRRSIVFYRTPAGTHDRDYRRTSLWAMNADGSGLRELIPDDGHGWELHGHAEWSPDGDHLVMFAGTGTNPQIVVTDREGQAPRTVTDRGGSNLDPAFTPDGEDIVFVGCPGNVCTGAQYEIYVVGVDGSGLRRLTHDASRDHDPYMAPDGSAIAWLRQVPQGWAIYTMEPDGSRQRALVADAGVNSKPAWSLDSSEIYFHGTPLLRTNFNVFAVDVASGERRELEHRAPIGPGRYDNEYPVHSSF